MTEKFDKLYENLAAKLGGGLEKVDQMKYAGSDAKAMAGKGGKGGIEAKPGKEGVDQQKYSKAAKPANATGKTDGKGGKGIEMKPGAEKVDQLKYVDTKNADKNATFEKFKAEMNKLIKK